MRQPGGAHHQAEHQRQKIAPRVLVVGAFLRRAARVAGIGLGLARQAAQRAGAVVVFLQLLRPQRPRIRKPWLLVPYIARIGVDVVASNWEVARDLLLNRHKPVHSAFVAIPLDLRDPSGLGALAMVTRGSAVPW